MSERAWVQLDTTFQGKTAGLVRVLVSGDKQHAWLSINNYVFTGGAHIEGAPQVTVHFHGDWQAVRAELARIVEECEAARLALLEGFEQATDRQEAAAADEAMGSARLFGHWCAKCGKVQVDIDGEVCGTCAGKPAIFAQDEDERRRVWSLVTVQELENWADAMRLARRLNNGIMLTEEGWAEVKRRAAAVEWDARTPAATIPVTVDAVQKLKSAPLDSIDRELLEDGRAPLARVSVTREQLEHAAAHPGEAWRAALAAKCDGNHGGPPCGDPECWAIEEPRKVPGPAAELERIAREPDPRD